MANHEIPNAFLIRALARSAAYHCEGCGSRMFVKRTSGQCPFCLSGHPPRVVHRSAPECADLPFAPRLGALDEAASGRVRTWLRARRGRPVRAGAIPPGSPQPSAS